MTALEAFWLRLSFLFLNISLDVNGNLWRHKFLSLQACAFGKRRLFREH